MRTKREQGALCAAANAVGAHRPDAPPVPGAKTTGNAKAPNSSTKATSGPGTTGETGATPNAPRTSAASAAPAAAREGAPLQAEAIQRLLHTQWLARSLQVLDETDSSNRVVMELAEAGAPHGLTVIAEAQSAGRGRHGRSFYSPARRNLYTSILLRANQGAALAPTLVFAAAAALAETTARELGAEGAERVQIKWPNDVLIDGFKTAGILVEGAQGRAAPAAVLGIGVNLNMAKAEFPEEIRARATSLQIALGRPVDRARFGARLYGALEELIDLHLQQGFAPVRARFEPFFKSTGNRVRVNDLGGRLQAEGLVLGIGSDGALRLAGADGTLHRVLAGDVTVAGEEST